MSYGSAVDDESSTSCRIAIVPFVVDRDSMRASLSFLVAVKFVIILFDMLQDISDIQIMDCQDFPDCPSGRFKSKPSSLESAVAEPLAPWSADREREQSEVRTTRSDA